MSDTFFGFNTDLSGPDGPGKSEDFMHIPGEEEFDLMNDETFGDLAEEDGDWEEEHEKLAGAELTHDSGFDTAEKTYKDQQEYMEESISHLVLDDDDVSDDPAVLNRSRNRPIAGGPIPMPGRSKVNLDELFGPSSPPAIMDTEYLVSPGKQNIWSSPVRENQFKFAHGEEGGVKMLMEKLHTPKPNVPFEDPSIVVAGKSLSSSLPTTRSPAAMQRDMQQVLTPKKAMTVEELEQQLRGAPVNHAVHTPGKAVPHQQGSPAQQTPYHVPPHLQQMMANVANGQHQPHGLSQGSPMPPMPRPGMPTPGMPNQGMPTTPSMPKQIPSQGIATPQQQLAGSPLPPMPRPGMPTPAQKLAGMAATPQGQQQLHRPGSPTQSPLPQGQSPHPQGQQRQQFPLSALQAHLMSQAPYGRGHMLNSLGGRMSPTQMMRFMTPQPVGRGGRVSPPGMIPYRGGQTPMHQRIPPHMGFSDPSHLHTARHMGPGPGRNNYPYQNRNNYRDHHRYPQEHPEQQRFTPHGHFHRQDRRYHQDRRRHMDIHDGRGDGDPYANLMTQREKDWIIKIQLLQLQTENPYLDDYYYTNFMMKKLSKEKEEEQNQDGHQPENEKEEPKLLLPQITKMETKAYKPAQFDRALGCLTASSVHNPRQIINVKGAENIHSEEGDHKGKDSRRYKQLLLDIEQAYTLMLTVDDLEKKLMALPEEARNDLITERRNRIVELYHLFLPEGSAGENLIQCMSVRKGKKLIARCLLLFDKEQCNSVLTCIMKHLSVVLKKDQHDKVLPQICDQFCRVVRSSDLPMLVQLADDLTSQTVSNPITQALQNKFSVSLLCSMLNQAESIQQNEGLTLDTGLENNWSKFVCSVGECLDTMEPNFSIIKPAGSYKNLTACFERHLDRKLFLAIETKIELLANLTNKEA